MVSTEPASTALDDGHSGDAADLHQLCTDSGSAGRGKGYARLLAATALPPDSRAIIQLCREFFIGSDDALRCSISEHGAEPEDGSGSGNLAAISGQNLETEMYNAFLKTWTRFRHNDEGVTLVEYGVAVALAVLVGTTAMATLSTDIGDAMGAAGAVMPD